MFKYIISLYSYIYIKIKYWLYFGAYDRKLVTNPFMMRSRVCLNSHYFSIYHYISIYVSISIDKYISMLYPQLSYVEVLWNLISVLVVYILLLNYLLYLSLSVLLYYFFNQMMRPSRGNALKLLACGIRLSVLGWWQFPIFMIFAER